MSLGGNLSFRFLIFWLKPPIFDFLSLQTGIAASFRLWFGPGQRLHLAAEVVSSRRLGVSRLWHTGMLFSHPALACLVTVWTVFLIKRNLLHPQAPHMPRLGLLAVAFSTGVVTIYSLPHPDALHASKKQENSGKVFLYFNFPKNAQAWQNSYSQTMQCFLYPLEGGVASLKPLQSTFQTAVKQRITAALWELPARLWICSRLAKFRRFTVLPQRATQKGELMLLVISANDKTEKDPKNDLI